MEWAYVAGFLDGDGCIILTHRQSRRNTNRSTGTYKGLLEPRITFGNTNKEAMLTLAEFLGVNPHVYIAQNNGTWPYRQPYYRLQFGGCNKIKNVLENCIPYLIIKKDIAELMLKFIISRLEKKRQMRKGTGGRVGYSEEEWEILRRVRAIQGRKGWKHRSQVLQHPKDASHG